MTPSERARGPSSTWLGSVLALGFCVSHCHRSPASSSPPPESLPDLGAPLSEEAATRWRTHLDTWTGRVLDPAYAPARERAAVATSADPRAPTVFAFWATYCPPCIEEIPMFDALFAAGHRIVGVSLDAGNLGDVKRILDDLHPRYPQIVLDEPSMKAAGRALERGLPATVVTDRSSRPIHALYGKVDRASVISALRAAANPSEQ